MTFSVWRVVAAVVHLFSLLVLFYLLILICFSFFFFGICVFIDVIVAAAALLNNFALQCTALNRNSVRWSHRTDSRWRIFGLHFFSS